MSDFHPDEVEDVAMNSHPMPSYSHMDALAIVADLLFENRVKAAMKKYHAIDKKTWDTFIKNDPSGGRQKYLDWMAKHWSMTPGDDLPEAEDIVAWVKELHKRKIDVNALPGLVELESKATGEVMGSKRRQIMRGGKILQDDADYLIVIPTTHQASKFYGGGTKWCVSTSNFKFWYDHGKSGELVFIKDRHRSTGDRLWKIAIYWASGASHEDPLAWEWFDAQDRKMDDDEKQEIWSQLSPDVQESIKDYFEYAEPEQYASEMEDEYIQADWADGGRHAAVKALINMVDKFGSLDEVDLLRMVKEVSNKDPESFLRFIHYVGFFNRDHQFDTDSWYVDRDVLEYYCKERGDDEEIEMIDQLIAMNEQGNEFFDIIQNNLDYWQFKELLRYWGEENLRDRLNLAAEEARWKKGTGPNDRPRLNVYNFDQVLDFLRSTDPVLHDYIVKLSTNQESAPAALVGTLIG